MQKNFLQTNNEITILFMKTHFVLKSVSLEDYESICQIHILNRKGKEI
jgi:hypothetical protein